MPNFDAIRRNADMIYTAFPPAADQLFFDELLMLEEMPGASEADFRSAKKKIARSHQTRISWFIDRDERTKKLEPQVGIFMGYDEVFEIPPEACALINAHEIGHFIWVMHLGYAPNKGRATVTEESFCDTLGMAMMFAHYGYDSLWAAEAHLKMRRLEERPDNGKYATSPVVESFLEAAYGGNIERLRKMDFKGLVNAAHKHTKRMMPAARHGHDFTLLQHRIR